MEVLGGGSGANSSEKLISDYTTTMMVICLGGSLGLTENENDYWPLRSIL